MMTIERTSKFKKDFKAILKRGYNTSEFSKVITLLAEGKELPKNYNDHSLSGLYEGCRECHIKPDWLLVYRYADNRLILQLIRTGSHSDLF